MAELIGARNIADFMGCGLTTVQCRMAEENLPVVRASNQVCHAKSQHIAKWQSDRKEGLVAIGKYLGVTERQAQTLKMHGDFEYYIRGRKTVIAYTKSLDKLMAEHPERLVKHYKGRKRDAK